MNKLLLIFASSLIVQLSAKADLKKDMDKFFNSFGASSNVNSAEIYQGQRAGYATGGSMSMRNQVMNSRIATVNLPEFNAGCGGIDIFSGGFSFISSDQLVANMKNIASSSVGYAFMLGIETVSPQIANTMRNLQTWANDINQIGINSCETAAVMVGSVWPAKQVADEQVCRTLGPHNGNKANFLQARDWCGSNKKAKQKTAEQVKNKYPNLLYGDYNLAWMAIQQQKIINIDNSDLAEIFMTITGTITSYQGEIKNFPSRITDKNLLKALLEGGSAEIYGCNGEIKDNKQCYVVKLKHKEIQKENAWLGKVEAMLISIQQKIIADEEELSEEEMNLLANSSLPLYKILSILACYKHGSSPIDLVGIADVIAKDVLLQCLKEGVEVVRAGCQQLKTEQLYENDLKHFMKSLEHAEKEIRNFEFQGRQRFQNELEIMKKIQMIEEQIAIEIGL